MGPVLPYTRISPMTRIRIERTLPAPGEILVKTGERVEARQKIARVPARGKIQVVNVARMLGLDNHDLSRVMVKKQGDRVQAGEILATRQRVLPFLHKPCRSPNAGRLAAIGYGWVVIELEGDIGGEPAAGSESQAIDLLALVTGQVTAIRDRRSVTIETIGAYIAGACSLGGEGLGVLQVSAEDRSAMLTADDIGMGSNNAILVAGAGVSPEALDRADEMKVKGIVVGGISSSLQDRVPAPSFPIVATEGYGKLPMSAMMFDILKQLEGRDAYISGQMGQTWDDTRPAIIVPLPERGGQEDSELSSGDVPQGPAQIGHQVRAVRHPHLSRVGKIVSIPAASQQLPSGLSLPGAHVAFADSAQASFENNTVAAEDTSSSRPSRIEFVPWLNLEHIG